MRKGPTESATKYAAGKVKKGNDGKMWKVALSIDGIHRWQHVTSKPKRCKCTPNTFAEDNRLGAVFVCGHKCKWKVRRGGKQSKKRWTRV